MKKWNLIDKALTPDGQLLTLHEHDGTYSIRIGGTELMSTRRHESEDRLAELACAGLKDVRNAAVLIGGLGFGFTLAVALESLAPDAVVVQSEVLAAVIAWNRKLALPALEDARVRLVNGDVYQLLKDSPASYDAVILDVDNGPEPFTVESNSRLYEPEGLKIIRLALRAHGRFAIWSARRNASFARRFRLESVRSGPHTIFIGGK